MWLNQTLYRGLVWLVNLYIMASPDWSDFISWLSLTGSRRRYHLHLGSTASFRSTGYWMTCHVYWHFRYDMHHVHITVWLRLKRKISNEVANNLYAIKPTTLQSKIWKNETVWFFCKSIGFALNRVDSWGQSYIRVFISLPIIHLTIEYMYCRLQSHSNLVKQQVMRSCHKHSAWLSKD